MRRVFYYEPYGYPQASIANIYGELVPAQFNPLFNIFAAIHAKRMQKMAAEWLFAR